MSPRGRRPYAGQLSVPDACPGCGSRRSVRFLEEFQTGGSGCDPRYGWRFESIPPQRRVSRAATKSGAAKLCPVWLTMCEVTRLITGSPQARVNVAGISAVGQRLEPSLYCFSIDPLCEGQALGLAQSGIVTVRAKRPTAGHAVDRDSAQDRCEFEGECLERPRKSRERLGLETFDIDLGKNRLAMTFDQLVQGDRRRDESAGPTLATPARRRRRRGDKA